ncbi:MAG: adenylyltransferase/cytidyltransferase family protein [Sedimentisphaerales bacterium]|nr:adenylyltransferase/cytidyltransferase family protein [Sedimentisphaerales bacterium]
MTNKRNNVVVYGGFDDIRSPDIRFLHEASQFGNLYVFLWSNEFIQSVTGKAPKFPDSERLYFLESIRFVHKVFIVNQPSNEMEFSAIQNINPSTWIVREDENTSAIKSFCEKEKIEFRVLKKSDMMDFPKDFESELYENDQKKVIVTGCFDWFHSGHVRFFEEVSEMGDLYVVVGNDANVRALKGENHPMFSQEERRYIAGSIRFVKQALISTGMGWLDAEPEIKRLKPDIYAVNEDGDKPEKEKYCQENGIEYVVLKRLPKEGLPKRQSTVMRGF